MSENDIIAEYVKANYPELLKDMRFTFFKIGIWAKTMVDAWNKVFPKIVDAAEEYLKESEEVDHE